ncbi:hypothetical protein BDV98DRAFT_607858 [Pterulicium gracile]|uniref:DUF6534 domain-containing protein n=1 Tax=Pterulicium gracile TaxID=1884261 RepID=A0A5C3Q9K8_9AGAR|nr:hypothetical protein BDV98DRAFT_607858 [Pterula gracilis]
MSSNGTELVAAPFPPIAEVTSAPFLGIMINWALMGVLTVQLYIYHINFYGKDRKLIQWLAYGLFAIDCVQTALATWDGIEWFVLGWGDPIRLTIVYTAGINSPLMDSLVALLVQSYYCWRIYILSGVLWWPMILIGLTLVQAGSGFASGIIATIVNDFRLLHEKDFVASTMFLSVTTFVDLAIAASTVYLLLRKADQQRLTASNFIVTKIVTLIVETNILTSSFAVTALAVFLSFPDRNYFLCPLYALGKLYSNSLFVMLNQRVVLNKATSNVHLHSSSNEMTQRHAAAVDFGAHNDNMAHRNQHETVFIRVDKTTMRDGDVERTMAANLPRDHEGYFSFDK